MRVLLQTDTMGENYPFTVDLAKSLMNYGNEVVLVLTGISLSKHQKAELQPFEYYYSEYKSEWMENPWGDIREAGKWLLKISEKIQPDVVHLNSISFGALQWNAPILVVYHSCMLSWWKALFDKPIPLRWTKYRQMIQRGLQNADMVISPTRFMFNQAERLYGPFKNSRIIPGGKSAYAFHSDVKERYIYSSGHLWDDGKNLSVLLEAAPKINFPIYIEGENQHVHMKNLPENVFCTGPLKLSQRADWLANAFICLIPSRYEPFGYTFIEAALSKCTLIGGDTGTLREIWQDVMLYVNGKEDLAEMVNNLMQNQELLYLYGQRAYETALEKYTLVKMTRHYIEAYQELSEITINVKQS